MKTMTANAEDGRFQTGAARYAAYLETPEGRLRIDLAFANLQEFLPQAAGSLRALDIGCGTGAIAVRLARLGIHVMCWTLPCRCWISRSRPRGKRELRRGFR